jgi:hypothetical protein
VHDGDEYARDDDDQIACIDGIRFVALMHLRDRIGRYPLDPRRHL